MSVSSAPHQDEDSSFDAHQNILTKERIDFFSKTLPTEDGTIVKTMSSDNLPLSEGKSVSRSFIGMIPILFAIIGTCVYEQSRVCM